MSKDNSSTPFFYINDVTWNCHYNNASIFTDSVNIKPGVCAYIPQVLDSVWLCQAPGPTCWSWNHACTGGADSLPGQDQIGCNTNGVSWCCLKDWEVCSGEQNQTNVCWANTFANPLFAIDPASPNASISAAVVLQRDGISTVVPPSTVTLAAPVVTISSGGNGTNEMCGPAPNVGHMMNCKRNKGTIAGTVIGGFIAVGLIMNAVLWIMRVRRRRRVRRKVLETRPNDTYRPRRTFVKASPSVQPQRSTSRLGLRERSNSLTRSASAASERHGTKGHDFEPEIRDLCSVRSEQRSKEKSATSSPTGTTFTSPSSPSHSLKAPSPTFRRPAPPVGSVILPMESKGERKPFRNIAEAYDDAPEDPTDLDGYVTFERGRRADRVRSTRQQRWAE